MYDKREKEGRFLAKTKRLLTNEKTHCTIGLNDESSFETESVCAFFPTGERENPTVMQKYLWASKEQKALGPEYIGLGQLALPILLESILRSTVGLIDVAFLSRLSDSVVSAVSVANQYIILCQIIASSLAGGSIVCINQAIGMKNYRRVVKLSSIALAANLLLGVVFGALFLFGSDALLIIMRMEPASMGYASRYMNIVGGMMIFQCVEIVSASLCRSMGHPNAPLIINLAENLVNIMGNYLAVFHHAALGIDPLDGVAMATVLSRVTGMTISLAIVHRAGVRFSFRSLVPFPKEDIRLSLSIGIPGGFNNIAYSVSQIVSTAIITILGETMVATKVYVNNIVHYIALVGMAFGSASSILIGYKIGAGEYGEASTVRALVTKIGLFSNIAFSLLFILLRYPLLSIFTANETILRVGGMIFILDLAVEIGRSLNNTIAGALQATGDVTYQLIVNQLSGWLVSVGGSYLFGIVFGWGLYGVWAAFAMDEMTRGLILLHRWRSGKWRAGAEARRKMIAGNG